MSIGNGWSSAAPSAVNLHRCKFCSVNPTLKSILRPVYRTVFRPIIRQLMIPLYRLLITPRWRGIIAQYRSGQVSEIDIELFRQLEGVDGLLIDAGANCGQFALSLLTVNRSLQVLSFEPNTALRWSLLLIALMHPRRFRFSLRGLGEQRQVMTLHVPTTGQMDLSSNASLDASEFDKGYVKQRLAGYSHQAAGHYGFRQRQVKLLPLDELQLTPVAIKIDVEGWEMQTLQGMQQTLARCHPLLMIEINNQHRFMPWLREMGYRFFVYAPAQQQLLPTETGAGHLNIFAIHPQMPAALAARIMPLLNDAANAAEQSTEAG